MNWVQVTMISLGAFGAGMNAGRWLRRNAKTKVPPPAPVDQNGYGFVLLASGLKLDVQSISAANGLVRIRAHRVLTHATVEENLRDWEWYGADGVLVHAGRTDAEVGPVRLQAGNTLTNTYELNLPKEPQS